MIHYDRKHIALAFGYAALAGAVDAMGFLESGGLFVSFMSGNSTRLGVGIASLSFAALTASALIALFVCGVVVAALLGTTAAGRPRRGMASICVGLFIGIAALCHTFGWTSVSIGLLCLAMGASNTVLQREGDVAVGVTYMTGTLVKVGHRLAAALRGGDRLAWLPYFLLWLSLVVGGVIGAMGFVWFPTASLWGAFAFSLVLAGLSARLAQSQP